MGFLQSFRLRYRAYKYRTTTDPGGISFLNEKLKLGQTVFDIGSHKGAYLFFMARSVGPGGKVFGFEPQSKLYHYLLKAKNFMGWKQVELFHLALSDSPGEATLFIPPGKSGSSPGASLHVRNETGNRETVKTETLDQFCKSKGQFPVLIKMDVEGHELKVLKGGKNLLKERHPFLLMEIEGRHAGKETVFETFRFLQELGYKGFFLMENKRKPISEFDLNTHQVLNGPGPYCNNFVFE